MERRQDYQPWMDVAEIKLVFKNHFKAGKRPVANNSGEAYHIFRRCWDMDTIEFLESFKVLYLTSSNRILGVLDIGLGGINEVIADRRIIMAGALKATAPCIILGHNHPSGDLKASPVDINFTRAIKTAALLLEIEVRDHLIIGPHDYYSMADEGDI